MLDALNGAKGKPLKDVLHAVKADVDAFIGDAPPFDDITMLGMTYFGPRSGNP